VLDLREPVHLERHFSLAPAGEKPYRLVVDLFHDPNDAGALKPGGPTALAREAPAPVVIAIDAGHGGRDPGAIGPGGTQEKAVVLEISQRLLTLINEQPGFRAILTRTDDTYIGLRQRTDIARQHAADLFISIHADAAQRRTAAGASIYGLSTRGASSATAQWLANSENRAVVSDDRALISLADHDTSTRNTLIDLSMGQSLNSALQAGDLLIRALDGITTLHKPQVELANFAVLRSPDMPSLLVETGFISNPEEERRLKSASHQRALAESLFLGLTRYFEQAPPSSRWHQAYTRADVQTSEPGLMVNENDNNDTLINLSPYATQTGETLDDIAQRYGLEMGELLARIDLTKIEIAEGQVITMSHPARETE
jgi:N-acetylmuramoyl-L-alanine amidase